MNNKYQDTNLKRAESSWLGPEIRSRRRRRRRRMGASVTISSSLSSFLLPPPTETNNLSWSSTFNLVRLPRMSFRSLNKIYCSLPESETKESRTSFRSSDDSRSKMEDYNLAMKTLMRNPYEYHHDLGQWFLIRYILICLSFAFLHNVCLWQTVF